MLELYKFIDDFLKSHTPQANFHLFRQINNKQKFVTFLQQKYSFLDPTEKIDRFVYHFYYDMDEIPKCDICKNELKYRSFGQGYANLCSSSCKTKKLWETNKLNPDTTKKGKETWKKKYSGDDYSQIQIKKEQTSIEKYGETHWLKSEIKKEEYKKYLLSKYGVDNLAKLDSSKIKISEKIKNKGNDWFVNRSLKYKDAIKEKYGVSNVFEVDIIKDKIINNNIEKYGVEYLFQSEEIRNKSKETNLKKYGFENPMQNLDIQEKHFKSSVNYTNIEIENKIFKLQGDEKLAIKELLLMYQPELIKSQFECPIFNYDFEGRNHRYRPDFYIEDINKIIEVKSIWTFFNDYKRIYTKYRSVIEKGYNFELWIYTHQKNLMIVDFNEDLFNILNKKNILDNYKYIFKSSNFIIIPEKKLIVNILLPNTNNNFFQKFKYNLSLKNNQQYEVISIFKDLLQNKFEIVNSRLKNKLGIIENKIYGRNTKIIEINHSISKKFLDINHIQGNSKGFCYLGLYQNEELVSVMVFSKPRIFSNKKDKDYIELVRFASKLDYVVIGGANKLFKYFLNKYNTGNKKILSYADYNWSFGNIYEKLKFKKIELTKPNYYYIKDGVRYHRYSFRKNKLVEMGYDKNLTEKQITKQLDLETVYDCGSIVYIYEI